MLVLRALMLLCGITITICKNSTDNKVFVKRVHGISITEIIRPDAVFESLIPAVFVVDLPKVVLNDTPSVTCKLNDFRCLVLQKEREVASEIAGWEDQFKRSSNSHTNVGPTGSSAASRSGRHKRQLALAAVAIGGIYALTHWGSNPSHDDVAMLRATDDVIKAHVKSLENAEARRSKQLALVKKDIQFLALHQKQVEDALMEGLNTTQTELGYLYNLQMRTLDFMRFMELLNSCRMRVIPEIILDAEMMRKSLKTIKIRADKHGMTPTINGDDIMMLYSKPIVKCVLSDTLALITVQIPLRRKQQKIKLYRIVPVSFQYYGEICKIEANVDFAAVVGKNVYSISNTDCDLAKGLCRVGQGSPALNTECIYNLLHKGNVKDLISKCPVKCTSAQSGRAYVTRVGHLTYIANVKTINVTCSNRTYTYTSENIGAFEIILSENCYVETGGDDGLIFPMYPTVGEEDLESDHVLHVAVPAIFTKSKYAVSSDDATFTSLRDLIDTQWSKKLNVVNLTAQDLNVEFPGWGSISPEYLYSFTAQKWDLLLNYGLLVALTIGFVLMWRKISRNEGFEPRTSLRPRRSIPLRNRLLGGN